MSCLSLYDYATLVGHYNCIKLGKTVDPRLLERGYTEAQLEALEKSMKRKVTKCHSLNIVFERQLDEYQYPLFGYALSLYRKYADGILPFPGSLADQPAQIIEIFNTLESVELEFRQKDIDEQERRAKRKTK